MFINSYTSTVRDRKYKQIQGITLYDFQVIYFYNGAEKLFIKVFSTYKQAFIKKNETPFQVIS